MPIHSFPASPSFFAVYNVAWIFDHVFVNNINVLCGLCLFSIFALNWHCFPPLPSHGPTTSNNKESPNRALNLIYVHKLILKMKFYGILL